MIILATSWVPNREEFLTALGVSHGGLGEYFFGDVYDALFIDSIELKAEFKNYYFVEYKDLATYFEIQHGETLSEEELEADRVFMVTRFPQVIDSVYDENKLDSVLECIRNLEKAQNESQT